MLEKTRLIDHYIWWQKKLTYFRRQNIYCRGWSLFRRHWSKKKYSYRKNCQETSNFGLQIINEFWNGMNGMNILKRLENLNYRLCIEFTTVLYQWHCLLLYERYLSLQFSFWTQLYIFILYAIIKKYNLKLYWIHYYLVVVKNARIHLAI